MLAGFGLDATSESVRSHLEQLGVVVKSVSVDQTRRMSLVTFENLSDAERLHSVVERSLVLINIPQDTTESSLSQSIRNVVSVAMTGNRAVLTFNSELDLWYASEQFMASEQNFLQVRASYVHPVSNHITVSDARGVRYPHAVERQFRAYGDSKKLPPDAKIVEGCVISLYVAVVFSLLLLIKNRVSVVSRIYIDFREVAHAQACAKALSQIRLADGTPVVVSFFHPNKEALELQLGDRVGGALPRSCGSEDDVPSRFVCFVCLFFLPLKQKRAGL